MNLGLRQILYSQYVICNYIEGNGGVINTNHIPTLNTSLEFEMMPLEYTGENYIGFPWQLVSTSESTGDNKDFRFFTPEQNCIYFDFSSGRIIRRNIDFTLNNWYTINCYNYGITINGTTYSDGNKANGTIANIPIRIFGNEVTGGVNFRLKYLKIYENGTLIKHLIAAKNSANQAGLYDLENNVWYESINDKQIIAK